jgi:hypothetical protein
LVRCLSSGANEVFDLVESVPLVLVLRHSLKHVETLQDIDDVVDSSFFDIETLTARFEVYDDVLELAVLYEEALAQLAQALLFSVVLHRFRANRC